MTICTVRAEGRRARAGHSANTLSTLRAVERCRASAGRRSLCRRLPRDRRARRRRSMCRAPGKGPHQPHGCQVVRGRRRGLRAAPAPGRRGRLEAAGPRAQAAAGRRGRQRRRPPRAGQRRRARARGRAAPGAARHGRRGVARGAPLRRAARRLLQLRRAVPEHCVLPQAPRR